MFEILSWSHRFLFIFFLITFFIISVAIYFYGKKHMSPFMPVIIILTAAFSFALMSVNDTIRDYKAIYIGLIFCLRYIIVRELIIKLLKIEEVLLFDLVNMLLTIGLIWLYRIEPQYATRQLIFTLLADTMYFFIHYLLNYLYNKIDFTKDYSIYLGLFILITLIVTQLWGVEVYGSKNWLEILGLRFQPSEFLKIFFIIFTSIILSRGLNKNTFIYSSSSIVIIVALFALQKDLGSALIFFAVYLIMLFIVDDKLYPTIISLFAAITMAVISYYVFGHIQSRVEAWLNPWKYISDKSYQVTQSLFAIASGGLVGTGLNLGYPKFIPAVHTDFIFSAICEEVGIISGIIIVLLLCIVTIIGLNYSKNSKKTVNKLICLGLSSITGIQTLIIVAGVLNIVPITGVTLPFISYGGSSLISQTINIGLLYFINMKENGEINE
ncbi:MAG: FtsW/RodA/SpoVE family cell cycle protein [Clostridiales bacterium]|nr:FtsW/RodA/SpoVE family cell cycle protein [Clostridiales bacterium]